MGLYLFIQVKATPAQAQPTVTPRPAAARPAPPPPSPSAPGGQHSWSPAQQKAHGAHARPAPTASDSHTPPPALETEEPDRHPDLKLDNLMELANKAYDRQDFDEAISIATKVLEKDPTNVRMLRVMVSANCIAGDSAVAQENYVKLPAFDRNQMRIRCDRYGVTFTEPLQ